MSKSTISTFELFQMFPDQETARAYFEAKRWPSGSVCPACNEAERIGTRKGGFYRCNACLSDFTVRTGTIFERSKIPLHVWAAALVLVHEIPPAEATSTWLANELDTTQKTAWLMLKRIRTALGTWVADRRPVPGWPAYSLDREGPLKVAEHKWMSR